ncbi:Hint domain-containing protein [Anianabacter salinae]|uniref:Hint domain-containing protein n=1 Tax=Anianabacter salinae TaxID=2851023 RepID=UPI00225E1A6E|nr:Hint domain-containing protein [Anianabacter salinae]MBV0912184.1 Hint domain-containing protein [Anianabacter salinae]
MPTTFNWIHLGNSATALDPTEGNSNAENAALFENQTYGTPGDPLYQHITSVTTIDNGGSATALDMNNDTTNDEFTTDIGSGVQTFTFDGLTVFNATITYANGTTATVSAVIAQSTSGELFLAPEISANADLTAYEAGPIVSITLDEVVSSTNTNLGADRAQQGWDDGVIDGTGGADVIDASYVEPIASGSDRVDNGDGLTGAGFNDDVINAGGGNDTVLAGAGDDVVSGGAGADNLQGQAGNDQLFGEGGSDTLSGGQGNDQLDGGGGTDTLTGGEGNDELQGGAGSDTLYGDGGTAERWSYEVYTRDFTSANGQAFTIESGTLAASGTSSQFDVTAHGIQARGGSNPEDFGVIYTSQLVASDTGVFRFETTSDDGSTIRILDSQGNPLTFANQTGGNLNYMNNDFHQGPTARFGDVTLQEGQSYTIEVRYWENAGGNVLSGRVTPPGGSPEDLATSPLIVGNDAIAGDDTLDGGAGADTLYGEGGNDTLLVGENDAAYGGDGDDTFTVQTPTETGTGTITIVGGEGDETDGDTLYLSDGITEDDITFTNTDDAAGGFSGSYTLSDGTVVSFSEIENIICFTPGAGILTPHGLCAVETLRIGDLVVTRDNGVQPIRWVGSRTVPGVDAFAPVRVAAHVMDGARAPLLVSPQHRLLFTGYKAELLFGCDEVLVAARHLIDGRDVVAVPQAQVTYIHVMFDRHEVIYADGAATESFHVGSVGLSALSDPSRDELFGLFPELRSHPETYGPTARPCLKKHEASLLRSYA